VSAARLHVLRCGLCGAVEGSYREIHEHLVADHADAVVIRAGPRSSYEVRCALCGEVYRQAIRRGSADGRLVDEIADAIRVVAEDILLQHLIGEHAAACGVADVVEEEEGKHG
jgi:hypothetical protein